jgi:hypothetical protein
MNGVKSALKKKLTATQERKMKMNCPHCDKEMLYDDYYGLGIPGRFDFTKEGDIYRCDNEDCEMYTEHFYTDADENIYKGYPC